MVDAPSRSMIHTRLGAKAIFGRPRAKQRKNWTWHPKEASMLMTNKFL